MFSLSMHWSIIYLKDPDRVAQYINKHRSHTHTIDSLIIYIFKFFHILNEYYNLMRWRIFWNAIIKINVSWWWYTQPLSHGSSRSNLSNEHDTRHNCMPQVVPLAIWRCAKDSHIHTATAPAWMNFPEIWDSLMYKRLVRAESSCSIIFNFYFVYIIHFCFALQQGQHSVYIHKTDFHCNLSLSLHKHIVS